ncbi:MAG: hypothetical protein Q9191_008529, partial [Dirinaria sp. TL-2023a]
MHAVPHATLPRIRTFIDRAIGHAKAHFFGRVPVVAPPSPPSSIQHQKPAPPEAQGISSRSNNSKKSSGSTLRPSTALAILGFILTVGVLLSWTSAVAVPWPPSSSSSSEKQHQNPTLTQREVAAASSAALRASASLPPLTLTFALGLFFIFVDAAAAASISPPLLMTFLSSLPGP